MRSAVMRNWSLLTAYIEQAPIPHAGTCSLRGYSLVVAVPPFMIERILPVKRDEMTQGILPWATRDAPYTYDIWRES
jgi:hypothetical protein